MDSKLFRLQYNRLNPEQKAAVDTIEGPVMVIAGPGTGKTQILILRIAKILLETQIEPENILALTFTESATFEMRKRLVELLGSTGYRVEINTFHGFCNKLIQHHTDAFTTLMGFESTDALEQLRMIERLIDEGTYTYIKPFGSPYHYAKSIIRSIDQLKKEGIYPDDLAVGLSQLEQEFNKRQDLLHDKGNHKGTMKSKYISEQKRIHRNFELLKIYREYEQLLVDEKKYDYNDMLLKVIQAFKIDSNLLLQAQELYQYILVDEHQDTNKAQNTIIELICNYYENPNLFVVGDEKQAIYRFQGANLENFLYFKERYKNALLVNLNKNYRSSQTILDAASSIITNNSSIKTLAPVTLLSQTKAPKVELSIAGLSTYYHEYFFIVDEIKKLIKKGIETSTIAVLVRNNKDLEPLIPILEKEGILYSLESDFDLLEHIEIEKLMLIFRTLYNLGDEENLIKFLHLDIFSVDPLDIYRTHEYARKKHIFLWDVLVNDTHLSHIPLEDKESLVRIIYLLKSWKKQSMNDSFDNLFITILQESGFQNHILGDRSNIDLIEKTSTLFDLIQRQVAKNHLFALKDFLMYIQSCREHGIALNATISGHKPGVRLMTVHKSKGREFDYVFIINCYNGHWGNKKEYGELFQIPWQYLSVKHDQIRDTHTNDDERRLFYVAITRARRRVILSYSDLSIDQKEQTVSEFIQEINPVLRNNIDLSQFEATFKSSLQSILEATDNKKSRIDTMFMDNKDFFNDLFERRGLSVSALNNFLDCPWKYFFRNLLLLPDVKNKSLIFGSAIHYALNTYILHAKETETNIKDSINSYNEYLITQPINEKELLELQKKGTNVLREYLEERAKKWSFQREAELTIKGVRFAPHVFLNGKIDMIERIDTKGNVRVFDFKTGKPKSRSFIEGTLKASTGDYKRQLVFYKILLDHFKYGRSKMNMQEGVIEFIEKDEKGHYHSETFTITQNDIDSLTHTIFDVAQRIRLLKFVHTTCDDKTCEYCRLRSFMG